MWPEGRFRLVRSLDTRIPTPYYMSFRYARIGTWTYRFIDRESNDILE